MIIKVLVENSTKDPCLQAEHGLSLYMECGPHRILFDMGQTDAFRKNAEKMNVDLTKVDYAVLSHGHYDHGGGLRAFLQVNDHAPVYVHKRAFDPHYHGAQKYIGLPASLQGHPQLHETDGILSIADGITLYGGTLGPCRHPVEAYGLSRMENGELIPDDFAHEQYLKIEENGQTVVISGCSHRGILNIMDWLHPDILIGGFHFVKLNPESKPDAAVLDEAARELTDYHAVYYTGHCTGTPAFSYLQAHMPTGSLHALHTGQTISL